MSSSSTSSTAAAAATTQLGNTLWAKQNKANAELFALTYGALVAELVRDLEQTDKIVQELDRMGHSMGIRCIEEVLAKAAAAATTSAGDAAAAAALSVQSFEDTKHVVKVAFRMFWGLAVDISSGTTTTAAATTTDSTGANTTMAATTTTSTDTAAGTASAAAAAGAATTTTNTSTSYTIRFTDNPLTIFVELPTDRQDLEYSQLLAGMVRGMLEMLQYDCQVAVVTSPLSAAAAAANSSNTTTPTQPSNVTEIAVKLQQVLQAGAGEEYQEE